MTSEPADPVETPSPWASPATRTEVPALPPAPPPPRDGKPRWLVAVIAAAIVLGAVGTALAVQTGGGLRALPAPTSDPPVVTPAPTASGYLTPGDMCEQADFTPLRPPFTTFGEITPYRTANPNLVVVGCVGATGNATIDGRFTFEVQVSEHPAALATFFDEQRATVAARVPVTAVDGLGARAYRYVAVGQTGLTVELYDDNVTMRLAWTADPGSRVPDGLDRALIETCRSTLRLMRPA